MACFNRASPALKETLLRIHHAKKPIEIDQRICEFGAVEYHIKSSSEDPYIAYLSISTPLLSQEFPHSQGIPHDMMQMIKGIHKDKDVLEISEPAKEGYQITLKLNFSKIPNAKDSIKVITEISTVQTVILSCQLKQILQKLDSHDNLQGMCKPIKLLYHPKEPFFVVRQPEKITAVFPMRFKEDSDVIIATAFFQELTDVGSSETWAKAPSCSWSPIPPPELRGEQFEDLNTNSGFVSFDITSKHVKGKKLDNTVWSLLNFYTFVKYHVKCTRGFIQRRMRKRLDSLVEILHKASPEEDADVDEPHGCRCIRRFARASEPKSLGRKCQNIAKKMRRLRSSIRIRGFGHFRRRWLRIPKFSSAAKYTKLD